MGGQLSVYDSFTLGKPFESEIDIWEICPAVRTVDDEKVTVFICDKEKQDDSSVDQAIKYFRTLRHPGLIKCLEVFDEYSEIAIVTEAVVPLVDVIADLYQHEVIAGIHNVIITVAFLHEKCKLSHNNLSMQSIFVGQNDACWKIAGFENMSSFSEVAEEKSIKGSTAHAQDVLDLGKLICDVLEQIDLQGESVITNFQQRIQEEILEASLEKRPQVTRLLSDQIFQNDYCQILDFLRNITVKTSSGKAAFFRTLHTRLHKLPAHVVANRLLHLLLSRFVLIDPVAVEIFLPHLLTPLSEDHRVKDVQAMKILPLLPHELYRECCIPILRKLFEVNDRHVRLILLKNFHLYVGMFEKTVLRCDILPELRLGLQDSDDELVSATFSALQYLVPLLGADAVIGGERVQQFTERRPKMPATADPNVLPSAASEARSSKQESTLLMLSKVKPSEGLQDKIQERERRREETRRRNEERRKQRQKTQMEKKLTMKATVVEHVQHESGDEFTSWDNFDDREEISDDSEHGRPSSSEISLDSGFSERPRHITEHPVSPQSMQNHHENVTEEINAPKLPEGKGFGMKLGKKGNKVDKDDKHSSGKECVSNQNNKTEDRFWTISKETSGINENILNSGEGKWTSSNDFPLLSPTNKSKKTKPPKTGSHHVKSDNVKNKIMSSQKVQDTPWEDFDIKVNKKGSVVDDIFAEMAPTLSDTRTALVKGTSIYSDKLAVAKGAEDEDGWMDDDW